MNEINTVCGVWFWPKLDIHNVRFISCLLWISKPAKWTDHERERKWHEMKGTSWIAFWPKLLSVGCKLYSLVGKHWQSNREKTQVRAKSTTLAKDYPKRKPVPRVCGATFSESSFQNDRTDCWKMKSKPKQNKEGSDLLRIKVMWCSCKHSDSDLSSIFTASAKWAF